MSQKNLAVFTGDSINEKMNGRLAARPKKVAVEPGGHKVGFHCFYNG